jgi:hypothetical protein
VICKTQEEALDGLARAEAEVEAYRVEVDRLDPELNADRTNWLVRKLDKAMRHLRDAEDLARLDPNFSRLPTADRIRFIYEQITEDVYNGSSGSPGKFEGVLFKAWEPTLAAILLELHEVPRSYRGQPVSDEKREVFLLGVDSLASRLGVRGLIEAAEKRRAAA